MSTFVEMKLNWFLNNRERDLRNESRSSEKTFLYNAKISRKWIRQSVHWWSKKKKKKSNLHESFSPSLLSVIDKLDKKLSILYIYVYICIVIPILSKIDGGGKKKEKRKKKGIENIYIGYVYFSICISLVALKSYHVSNFPGIRLTAREGVACLTFKTWKIETNLKAMYIYIYACV